MQRTSAAVGSAKSLTGRCTKLGARSSARCAARFLLLAPPLLVLMLRPHTQVATHFDTNAMSTPHLSALDQDLTAYAEAYDAEVSHLCFRSAMHMGLPTQRNHTHVLSRKYLFQLPPAANAASLT